MTDDYKTVRRIIEDVEDLVHKLFQEHREFDDANSELYYMNGNDGTDFDWKVNGHICELMVFHPNDNGAIKILITHKGNLYAYMYGYNAMLPFSKMDCKARYSKDEVETLAEFLFDNLDGNKVWDLPISVADLDASDYTEWQNPHWFQGLQV